MLLIHSVKSASTIPFVVAPENGEIVKAQETLLEALEELSGQRRIISQAIDVSNPQVGNPEFEALWTKANDCKLIRFLPLLPSAPVIIKHRNNLTRLQAQYLVKSIQCDPLNSNPFSVVLTSQKDQKEVTLGLEVGSVSTDRGTSSVTLTRKQFPFTLHFAETVRKLQGVTLRGVGAINLDTLGKGNYSYAYVAFSRFTSGRNCFPIQKVTLEDFTVHPNAKYFDGILLEQLDNDGWISMRHVAPTSLLGKFMSPGILFQCVVVTSSIIHYIDANTNLWFSDATGLENETM